jgi:hypothetical protein
MVSFVFFFFSYLSWSLQVSLLFLALFPRLSK